MVASERVKASCGLRRPEDSYCHKLDFLDFDGTLAYYVLCGFSNFTWYIMLIANLAERFVLFLNLHIKEEKGFLVIFKMH
jgi:hypothetical protein